MIGSGLARWGRAWQVVFAGLVVLLLAVEGAIVLDTPTLTYSSNQFVIDLWFTLDSMWRAVGRQVPNVDFHSPIGPAFYAVYALVGQVTPFALVMMLRADLLVGLVAAGSTFAMLWRRAPVEAVALLALIAFCAAVTGHEMGSGPFDRFYSFLAPYNRWGWALIVPAAAAMLIPTRRGAVATVLAGMLGAFLLFLKLSYFIVFVGFCLVSIGLDLVEARARLSGVLLLVVPVVLTVVVYVLAPAMTAGYAHDVAQVAAINSIRLNKIALSVPEAGITAIAALLVLRLAGGLRRGGDWPDAVRVLVAVGGGALILLQNHDRSEAPVYGAALVIAYAIGRVRHADALAHGRSASDEASGFVAFAMALVMVAPTLFSGLFSPMFQWSALRSGEIHAFAAFDGTPLSTLRLKDLSLPDVQPVGVTRIGPRRLPRLECTQEACAVMKRTADGVVALRNLRLRQGSRVLALDFSNPFPAILGTPVPRFGYSWYDYSRSWTEAFGPTPERLFAEADVTLEPLFNGSHDQMRRVYSGSLPRFYRLVAQTPYWRVWAKPGVVEAPKA